MRITNVTTRSGDEGNTSLASGDRVSKASQRVCAYGDVDELNSFLGLTRSRIVDGELQQLLERIQNDLFVLGADLATPVPESGSNKPDPVRRTSSAEIENLEKAIDQYNKTLPPLEEFILPAGSEAAALLHVARAVTRRAERQAVHLAQAEHINPHVVIYLNRLSDLLFVLARVVNRQSGSKEVFAKFT
ncbi:MAG: cob(I)yrinic acid a,c-diamide adenosyltransferase [Acidobacteria bacterium]|nr:cob(I)yrinic acid a,c-diamide adenosyltransferase [Acidobacteriota bacterium]